VKVLLLFGIRRETIKLAPVINVPQRTENEIRPEKGFSQRPCASAGEMLVFWPVQLLDLAPLREKDRRNIAQGPVCVRRTGRRTGAERFNYLDNRDNIEEQIQTVRKLIPGLVRYLRARDGKR